MSQTLITGPGIPEQASPETAADQRSIENPNVPITADQLAHILSGGPTASGQSINERGSLKISVVWAAARIVANAVGKLPFVLYEDDAVKGRVRAAGHPVYRLLKRRPHPDVGPMMFWSTMMVWAQLWGNAYAEIVRDGSGRPIALEHIESARVKPFRKDGQLRYEVAMEKGGSEILLKRDMFHIAGMSLNGVTGLSVIAHARETLGVVVAQERFSAKFYHNGCRPSGVLEHPGTLSKKDSNAVENLRRSWADLYAGPENAGKPIILEEGMKWNTGAMIPPQDAQFIETYGVRIEDICRWFGVQPHKVFHLIHANNNSLEQQDLSFLADTLEPWLVRIAEEAHYKLLSESEQERYYPEHLTQALVKLDANTRTNMYVKLHGIGAITSDEICDRENLERLEDERGTVAYVPSNMMPAPNPEQADKLLDAWIKKGAAGGGKPGGDGQPNPETDDKVAKAG